MPTTPSTSSPRPHSPGDITSRRGLLIAGAAAGAAAVPLLGPAIADARRKPKTKRRCPRPAAAPAPALSLAPLVDAGVGMYTADNTALMFSSFTVNQKMVSCGVGTVGLPRELLGGAFMSGLKLGDGLTGPFAMNMFSTRIDEYLLDRNARTIRVSGRMRSQTFMGAMAVDDVEHDFNGIGVHPDRFTLHFRTPFWKPGNPLAFASKEFPGKVFFGGRMQLGFINVAR